MAISDSRGPKKTSVPTQPSTSARAPTPPPQARPKNEAKPSPSSSGPHAASAFEAPATTAPPLNLRGADRRATPRPSIGERAKDVYERAKDVYENANEGLEKLGLDQGDLKDVGEAALPHLKDAAMAAKDGRWDDARAALLEAGLSPEARAVAAKALAKVAEKLPDGIAKRLLSDPQVTSELLSNPRLHASFRALFDDRTRLEGLRGLLSEDGLRDKVLGELAKEPAMVAALEKVGLTAEDFQGLGAAAPYLIDVFVYAKRGRYDGALASFESALRAAPGVSARLAEVLVDRMPQGLKDKFATLGLTADDLKASAAALPHLYYAVQLASEGDEKGMLLSLRNAMAAGSPAVEKAIHSLASKLPEGPGRAILMDEALVHQLVTNTAAMDSVAKLFDGRTRVTGIRELVSNDALRDEVLRVAGSNEPMSSALAKVGLTAADLQAAGRAAPALWSSVEAFSEGRVRDGLLYFQEAITQAPELSRKLAGRVVEKLPDAVKEKFAALGLTEADLESAVGALPHLYDAAEYAAAGDWKDAVASLKEAAFSSAGVGERILEKVASKLPAGPVKTVLMDPAVRAELVVNRELYTSIGKLLDGRTRMTGVRELLGNDYAREAILGALGTDPKIAEGLEKLGLTPDDLLEAGRAAPHLYDAVQALADGKLIKAADHLKWVHEAAPELLSKVGTRIFQALPEGVKAAFAKIDLSPEELGQLGAALPNVLYAIELARAGKPQEALAELRVVLDVAPDVVAHAIAAVAGKLPAGVARTLLTDRELLKTLLTDRQLHDSLGQLMSGTAEGVKAGLVGLSANRTALTAMASALWSDEKTRAGLQKLGFRSAADLAEAGTALDDLVQMGELLKQDPPNVRAVINQFGELFQDLPDALQNKIGDAVGKALHLPPGLSDLLIDGAQALVDPRIRGNLAEAMHAFARGNPGEFVSNMAETAKLVAQHYPEAAIGLLNMMGKLPGSVGRFFSNPELNKALVESKAVEKMFAAIEKAGTGDIAGAMKMVAEAAGSFIGYGENIGVDLPLGKHIETPVSVEGLKATGLLFQQFVEALPAQVKAKITAKVAELLAKAGASIIPGGSLLGLVSDVPSLVNALREDPKDWVKIVIESGEVALDVAGVIPGVNAAIPPLKTALGTIAFVKDAKDLVDDVQEFRSEFAFG